jgi:hypothetical protein
MPKDKPDAVLTRMLNEKPMTKAEISVNIRLRVWGRKREPLPWRSIQPRPPQ